MRVFTLHGVAASGVLLSGCASIVSGHNQSLSVATTHESVAVSGAKCQLSNNKGMWYVTTPGTTVVHRSFEDLAVKCESDGYEPAMTSVKSTTKGMAFGNILFGGLIGAGVDISTGAAYDYPNVITVTMGRPSGAAPNGEAQPQAAAIVATMPAAGTSGALRRGDALEYAITERYTGAVRHARWTVDEVDAERIVFNGGDRVENARGGLVTARAANAGDLDSMEPPNGWIPPELAVGRRWNLKYEARDGSPASRVDLEAHAVLQGKVETQAGSFDAIQIVFMGYAQRSAGAADLAHAVEFKLWYDPAQRRVVLFESEIRPGQTGSQPGRPSRERIELVRVVRAS